MSNRNNSLEFYKLLLIILITSLSITSISYLDGKVWDIVMIVIEALACSIVSILFSVGLLHGKSVGKKAYAFVFIILLILGYCVYSGIVAIQNWITAWPQHVKIVVPSLFFWGQ